MTKLVLLLAATMLCLGTGAVAAAPQDDSADLAKSCPQLTSELATLRRPAHGPHPLSAEARAVLAQLPPSARAAAAASFAEGDDDSEERQQRIDWLTRVFASKHCALVRPAPAPPVHISIETLDRRPENLNHCDAVFQSIGLILLGEPLGPDAEPIRHLYGGLGNSNRDLWEEQVAQIPAERANPNIFTARRDAYLGDYLDRNRTNYRQLRGDYDQCVNSGIFPGPRSRTARASDYYAR